MMNSGKLTTIARPYVAAAFEYALANKDLVAWEVMLQTASAIAQDPKVAKLMADPNVTKAQLTGLFCDILKPWLNEQRTNFVHLLAQNNRLSLLPDIAELFAAARAAQEKTIYAEVTSAVPLDEAYQQKLIRALTERLQRQVELQCVVSPELLGGATIRVGDMVIDGSIRGKLNRMIEFI